MDAAPFEARNERRPPEAPPTAPPADTALVLLVAGHAAPGRRHDGWQRERGQAEAPAHRRHAAARSRREVRRLQDDPADLHPVRPRSRESNSPFSVSFFIFHDLMNCFFVIVNFWKSLLVPNVAIRNDSLLLEYCARFRSAVDRKKKNLQIQIQSNFYYRVYALTTAERLDSVYPVSLNYGKPG